MAQITVSISDELEKRLRRHAEVNGYATLSALVSDAIREKLDGSGDLTYAERVSLVIQLENNRLLSTLAHNKQLIEDKDWHFERLHAVLSDGYKSEYSDALQFVSTNELPESSATFVYDVLDAYRDMQWSAKELKDKDIVQSTRFPGFDGNSEYELMGYVRYLVEHDRWTEVVPHEPSYNSHGMEPDYRSLVQRHKEVRERKRGEDRFSHDPLSKEEILYILGR